MDKPTQKRLQREAARLIREDKMPSLEELCAAVLETRKEFAVKIRRAHAERLAGRLLNQTKEAS